MTDVASKARVRIMESSDQYQNSLLSITKFRFDKYIKLIFDDVAKLLESSSKFTPIIPKVVETPTEKVAGLRSEIDDLQISLGRRLRAFDSAIAEVQQIFTEKTWKFQDQFKKLLSNLQERYIVEEKAKEDSFRDLSLSFETRLRDKIALCLSERNAAEASLTRLQNEYNLTKMTLTASLSAALAREEVLHNQSILLQATHKKVTKSVGEKNDQQLEAIGSLSESQKAIITDRIERARRSLEEHKRQVEADISSTQAKILKVSEEQSKSQDAALTYSLIRFEKAKRKASSRHERQVIELNHNDELSAVTFSAESQLLSAQIQNIQHLIQNIREKCDVNLSDVEAYNSMVNRSKSNEVALISKLHGRSLKQIQKKNALEIEAETRNSMNLRKPIEQKLEQISKFRDATKSKLTSEIFALRRAKDKLEAERRTPADAKVIREVRMENATIEVFHLEEQKRSELSTEMAIRSRKLALVIQKEGSLLEKVFNDMQTEYSAQTKQLEVKKNQMKLESESLEREKVVMEKMIFDTKVAIKNEIEARQTKSKEEEEKLKLQIAAQHSETLRLRDEISKASGERKIKIEDVKEEQLNEVESSNSELKAAEERRNKEIEMAKEKIETEAREGRERTQDVLKSLESITAEVNKQIIETQNGLGSPSGDHQQWVKIRQEIADSNNRISELRRRKID